MFDRNKDKHDAKDAGTVAATTSRPAAASSAAHSGSSRRIATIGATVTIRGDVSGDEDLLVEGCIEGTISLPEHELVVGESGRVHADLVAKVVRIGGEVKGDIIGRDKVIVASTSKITGNIMTPRMTLDEGARFKGCIDIDPKAGQSGGKAETKTALAPLGTVQSAARPEPTKAMPAVGDKGGDAAAAGKGGTGDKA